QQAVENTNEVLKAELSSRAWRALKLSAILQKFEDPNSTEIGIQAYERAIDICMMFTDYPILFDSKDDINQLTTFLIKNRKEEITLASIRNQKFTNKNYFSKWLNEVMPLVQDELAFRGYKLIKNKGERNSSYFTLQKNPILLKKEYAL